MEFLESGGIVAGFGTFGDLVEAVSDLVRSSGLELVVNFLLIVGLSFGGFSAGRWAVDRGLAFAALAAAVGAAMFVSGAQASYFVVNAGTFFLGFAYPVWEEAYVRVSG